MTPKTSTTSSECLCDLLSTVKTRLTVWIGLFHPNFICLLLTCYWSKCPRDLWFTNLCKFWHTFQPIQIKYVKWNGNANDVICETATSRQFDAVSSLFLIIRLMTCLEDQRKRKRKSFICRTGSSLNWTGGGSQKSPLETNQVFIFTSLLLSSVVIFKIARFRCLLELQI